MPEMPIDPDPAPVPPLRPDSDDCCRSGCEPCIFERYEESLERFRAEYQAWEKRRAEEAADQKN